MIKIMQKRLRSLKKYSPLLKGSNLIVCVDLNENKSVAAKIGFSNDFEQGETVLPTAIGNVSRFNAEGKEIVRRDLPKETHYNSVESPNWGDSYNGTHTVELPYQKYPRDFIEPPSVELKISGDKIISPLMDSNLDDQGLIHTINLFLELFGECILLNEKFEDFVKVPSKSLNWEVLPMGEMPWERLHGSLKPLLKKLDVKEKVACEERIKTLQSYSPDFTARGTAGFSGYLIFGFKNRDLYVCESIWHGNAIYVFEGGWEELSKKTKAEVLRGGLQKDRIIHAENWKEKLDELLI